MLFNRLPHTKLSLINFCKDRGYNLEDLSYPAKHIDSDGCIKHTTEYTGCPHTIYIHYRTACWLSNYLTGE